MENSTLENLNETEPASNSNNSPLSNVLVNPIHKALETPLILDEIFKLLSFKDRKTFRKINRLWKHETQAIWRRDAWLILKRDYQKRVLSLQNFHQLFWKAPPDGEWTENEYGLLRHPFRHVRIRGEILSSFIKHDPNKTQFFWNFYGIYITHLELRDCRFAKNQRPFSFILEVVLNKCPNLKEFTIGLRMYRHGRLIKRNSQREHMVKCEGKVAENLKKLYYSTFLEHLDVNECRNILKLVPNIKDFAVDYISALNILKEEQMKIHKFVCSCRHRVYSYMPLLEYVEAFPFALKELNLALYFEVGLFAERSHPLNGSLLHSRSLTILKLSYHQSAVYPSQIRQTWFTDFRGIFLPNLKELEINFLTNIESFHFDFLTVAGLPKLEILNIRIEHKNCCARQEITRRPGTADWICEAPEAVFSYPGFQNVEVERERWVGCESLRKVTFEGCGWQLNEKDIIMFHGFFPYLEYLGAALSIVSLCPLFVQFGKRLKMLVAFHEMRCFQMRF